MSKTGVDSEKSPYEISLEDQARLCDSKHGCPPFYIREWETMIVAAIIIGIVVYVASCCCGSSNPEAAMYENFKEKKHRTAPAGLVIPKGMRTMSPFHARYQTPHAHQRQLNGLKSGYAAAPATQGQILTGVQRTSQGPAVERFIDFARIDAIDRIKPNEPNPTYHPETPDDDLLKVLRSQ